MPLRDHQHAPAKALSGILDRFGSGVDFSDPGAGKTFVACSVIYDSKLPTLVVGPKIAESTWRKASETFGDSVSYVGYELLRAGNTPFGKWTGGSGPRVKYYKCQCCQRTVDLNNYQPCYCHPQGIHCLETKTKQHDYGQFIFAPEVRQVVFDECHRAGGIDSLNADLLIAAKRQGMRILGLTATAGCSPLQFKALGYTLDLHGNAHDVIVPGRGIVPNFYRWARKYGCRRDPAFHGFRWMAARETQGEIMAEIRDSIIPARGVRVRRQDIPGFPEVDIQPELYDVSEPEVFNRLYEEVREAQEALKLRAEGDVAPDSPITKMLRARQKIELLKAPIAAELGDDYLEKGFSVVWFVNFRQTIDELAKRFPDALIIDGSPDSVRHREQSIDRFQTNDCRRLIVNNAAGGVSISMQDLTGYAPRVGLVFPCFSADIMRQVFGRLPRDGGKSLATYRVMLAAKTIETKIHYALRCKLDNMDALNDADLNPGNLVLQLPCQVG